MRTAVRYIVKQVLLLARYPDTSWQETSVGYVLVISRRMRKRVENGKIGGEAYSCNGRSLGGIAQQETEEELEK